MLTNLFLYFIYNIFPFWEQQSSLAEAKRKKSVQLRSVGPLGPTRPNSGMQSRLTTGLS
jgi:hypothetical protein